MDIMYVEELPSLIGLATPLDLTMAVSLLAFDSIRGTRSVGIIRDGTVECPIICVFYGITIVSDDLDHDVTISMSSQQHHYLVGQSISMKSVDVMWSCAVSTSGLATFLW